MDYKDHFALADDYLAHVDSVIGSISDQFIKSRYTGFLAVSAVTVYELAIKTIFIKFAQQKHRVLGNFAGAYFERINGRIKPDVVKGEYIKKFGEKYVRRFERTLDSKEREILRAKGSSVKTSYTNIITWRNEFAHEGKAPTMATYDEVKNSYELGKELIHCLAKTMRR